MMRVNQIELEGGRQPTLADVVGIFDKTRCLMMASPLLEELLGADLIGKKVRPSGSLDKLFDEMKADGEMRFFRLAYGSASSAGTGPGLYNIVLDPIRDVSSGEIRVAVLAPRIELAPNWVTVYTELAKAHQATMDLRLKLLAALPVLTGAGVALIIGNSGLGTHEAGGLSPWSVIALGLFGLVVSFGLFMYELRNIRECVAFLHRGAALEALVGAPAGQFLQRPESQLMRDALRAPGRITKKGWISIHRASHVVYISILVAWLALILFGVIAVVWPTDVISANVA